MLIQGSNQELFDAIDAIFHFDLDAAADESNAKCAQWLGPGSKLATNALTGAGWSYGNRIWCNPPLLRWGEFVTRVRKEIHYAEAARYLTLYALLVPARTDAKEFPWDADLLVFLKDTALLPDFEVGDNATVMPLAAVLAIYGDVSTAQRDALEDLGVLIGL